MRRPPQDQTPLASTTALTALWQRTVAWEPLRVRSIWLLFIDARARPSGPLITIDDVADGPYAVGLDELVDLCRGILDGPGGGGSVAMLMSRAGGAPWTVSDRAWGRFLTRGAEELGPPVWPVHLAHSQVVERFRLPARRR
ncbi:hypothetical protein EFL95_05340 [Nocardioides marmorisolisilvae]|uniref:Uncharacterized protein n=1 Tax=Nocardioides marmorisolisilvae TaxID=1542737 RepID=A0A3N0DSC1_9ACTN|nr:hypothetical protein EFL95_05340 [Nocardioides marmorisolisilvae]